MQGQFELDKEDFPSKFNVVFDEYFVKEQDHIQRCVKDELITLKDSKIFVTELGKLFIRNICMGFDFYLQQQKSSTKFSRTV